MTFDESTRIITRITELQNRLFDYTGHVRLKTPRDEARYLVERIDHYRELVGWKPLDMGGRWKGGAKHPSNHYGNV